MRCRRAPPIERRTAISPARPTALASSRLAMFAQALSRTTKVTESRRTRGTNASSGVELWPRAPGVTSMPFALKRSMLDALMPCLERDFDLVDDRVIRLVDRRGRGFDADTGLQSCEQVDPVGAPVIEDLASGLQHIRHRDRHEELRTRSDRRAIESLGRHADDSERLAIDDEGLAEDALIGGEPPGPVTMAEHDDIRLADDGVVSAVQQPARGGHESQHLKVAGLRPRGRLHLVTGLCKRGSRRSSGAPRCP